MTCGKHRSDTSHCSSSFSPCHFRHYPEEASVCAEYALIRCHCGMFALPCLCGHARPSCACLESHPAKSSASCLKSSSFSHPSWAISQRFLIISTMPSSVTRQFKRTRQYSPVNPSTEPLWNAAVVTATAMAGTVFCIAMPRLLTSVIPVQATASSHQAYI